MSVIATGRSGLTVNQSIAGEDKGKPPIMIASMDAWINLMREIEMLPEVERERLLRDGRVEITIQVLDDA